MAANETVYPNLVAEMSRIGVNRKDIASFLDRDPNTVGSWMLGQNGDFSVTQALAVQQHFFPNVKTNELFRRKEVQQ